MVVACSESGATTLPLPNTVATGTVSTLLGRAAFATPFKLRRTQADWDMQIEVSKATDVAVQNITFEPAGQSGWHSHPGPVFIQVVSGSITFYDSDDPGCKGIVRTAGQGFLDVGDHPHLARNETALPATNVVTYFAPPGATLRIDAPKPANCPF